VRGSSARPGDSAIVPSRMSAFRIVTRPLSNQAPGGLPQAVRKARVESRTERGARMPFGSSAGRAARSCPDVGTQDRGDGGVISPTRLAAREGMSVAGGGLRRWSSARDLSRFLSAWLRYSRATRSLLRTSGVETEVIEVIGRALATGKDRWSEVSLGVSTTSP